MFAVDTGEILIYLIMGEHKVKRASHVLSCGMQRHVAGMQASHQNGIAVLPNAFHIGYGRQNFSLTM
jgi:hypothetical protein